MKKVYNDKIINIDENLFDNKFLIEYLNPINHPQNIEVIYMEDLLKKKENTKLLNNLGDKYAMYSNVYSPKDELEIFKELFDNAIKTWKKIHIIWVTLKEEIEILEKYYNSLWFMREDINCFDVDFSIPLVTVSVKIENLIWKWSDYKRMKKFIFFIPPIRESWENRAMFKWITRWVIAWIYISKFNKEINDFLNKMVVEEKILPINLAKVLYYNIKDIWFTWEKINLLIEY